MKRKKIDLQHLQNAEHFELHADVIALATEITPVALKSIEQCAEYKRLFAAAHRLAPVFKTYGGLAGETHAKESADIYNLLKELTENHADDCSTLGLPGWITALDKANTAVQKLSAERYEETAGRADTTLRQAREAVDAAWEVLTACIYALSLMAAPAEAAGYEALIRRLNTIVEHYATILAQQAGRRAAEKAKEEAAKPKPEPRA